MLTPRLPNWNWAASLPLLLLFGVSVYGLTSPEPPSRQTAVSNSDEKPNQEIPKEDPNERLANYTLGLEIFTALLVGLGALNIWALFKSNATLALTADIDRRQERATRIYQRAWISAVPNEMVLHPDNETVLAVVSLKNHGQTPAFDTQASGILIVAEYPMKQPIDIKLIEESAPAATYVIFPDGQHIQVIATELRGIALDDKHALYVVGMITYRDAFGAEQWTEYCSALDRVPFQEWLAEATKPGQLGAPIEARFKFTPFNNRASENLG